MIALDLPPEGAGRRDQLRSEEHTSELQSQSNLVCRLLLEKKNRNTDKTRASIRLQAWKTSAHLSSASNRGNILIFKQVHYGFRREASEILRIDRSAKDSS